MKAWHFVKHDGTGTYLRDPAHVGQHLVVSGPIRPSVWGLHGCVAPFRALTFAQGPVVCRVELAGQVENRLGLYAATERTVLAITDATSVLQRFALDTAAALLSQLPADQQHFQDGSQELLRLKEQYLQGELSACSLKSQRDETIDRYPCHTVAWWSSEPNPVLGIYHLMHSGLWSFFSIGPNTLESTELCRFREEQDLVLHKQLLELLSLDE